MAAQRPPGAEPIPETLDDADMQIDQTAPPQRSPLRGVLPFGGGAAGRAPGPPGPPPHAPPPGAPPRPHASPPGAPPRPHASPPGAPPRPNASPPGPPRPNAPPPGFPNASLPGSPVAAAAPASPWAAHAPPRPNAPPSGPGGAAPFGEETAAAEPSPLAAALPFRHARAAAPGTVGFPMPTPEDLRRLASGGPDPSAAPAIPGFASALETRAKRERANLEAAKTVAFAMPPAAAAAAPASPPASPQHFGLTLEQYATLCSEIAVFPERADAIFAQYGLTARQDRLTADAAWQEKLRADNALMARWQGLYLHYHEHYARLKGR